jgi:hypothetical protein
MFGMALTVGAAPDKAMSRFILKSIAVKKRMEAPQHEFVLIRVKDTQDDSDRFFIHEFVLIRVKGTHNNSNRFFILERTVNINIMNAAGDASGPGVNDQVTDVVADFFQHEDWNKIVDAVSRGYQAIPIGVLAGAAGVVGMPVLPSALFSSAIASLTVATLISSTSTPANSLLLQNYPIAAESSNGLLDQATLTLVQGFNFYFYFYSFY